MSQGTRIKTRLEEIADQLNNLEAQRFKLGRSPRREELGNPGAVERHTQEHSRLNEERRALIDERCDLEREYDRLPPSAR